MVCQTSISDSFCAFLIFYLLHKLWLKISCKSFFAILVQFQAFFFFLRKLKKKKKRHNE